MDLKGYTGNPNEMHHCCLFFSTQWFGEQLQKHDYTPVQDVCPDRVMLQSTNQLVGLNYGEDLREFNLCLCEIVFSKKSCFTGKGGANILWTYPSVGVHTVMNTQLFRMLLALCTQRKTIPTAELFQQGLIKQSCIQTEIRHHAFLEITVLEANKAS